MSSESKHTPGPWIVMHGDNGYPSGISAPGDAGIPGAVGCIVRNGGIGLPSSDAGKANARLIAAAPDLLAALEPLAALLQPHMDEYQDDRVFFAVNYGRVTIGDLRRARAAIAKAEAVTP